MNEEISQNLKAHLGIEPGINRTFSERPATGPMSHSHTLISRNFLRDLID